ncbi:hypothetical protein [Acidovorax sp. K2F]|uniref:hypothetical protein n=1 Tax=Acidovorax sp. K2F TaxID=2978125 RepID=UPI0021B14A23|nr:hypothetical protein [Acidovorax sp. K2F]MCT6717358.1 hypothetical protein [Acidovorax sp. K2F]
MPDLHSRVCYKCRAARPWCTGVKVQQKVALKLLEKPSQAPVMNAFVAIKNKVNVVLGVCPCPRHGCKRSGINL